MAAKRTVFDIVGGSDLSMGPGAAGGAAAEGTDWIYRAYRKSCIILQYLYTIITAQGHKGK